MGKKMRIKICDFGFAVFYDPNDKPVKKIGTLEYMSPEMLKGQEYDMTIDLRAIIIMMYELLVSYNPYRYEETKEKEIHRNILNNQRIANESEKYKKLEIHVKKFFDYFLNKKTNELSLNEIKNNPMISFQIK